MSKFKKNKAVALRYSAEEDAAPVVIASGYGTIADKIIDIAEQKGIPVFRDDSAASLMCMLEVGSQIPTELYEVVAAIYLQLLKTAAEIKGQSGSATEGSPFQGRPNRLLERRNMNKNNQEQGEYHELSRTEEKQGNPEAGEEAGDSEE